MLRAYKKDGTYVDIQIPHAYESDTTAEGLFEVLANAGKRCIQLPEYMKQFHTLSEMYLSFMHGRNIAGFVLIERTSISQRMYFRDQGEGRKLIVDQPRGISIDNAPSMDWSEEFRNFVDWSNQKIKTFIVDDAEHVKKFSGRRRRFGRWIDHWERDSSHESNTIEGGVQTIDGKPRIPR